MAMGRLVLVYCFHESVDPDGEIIFNMQTDLLADIQFEVDSILRRKGISLRILESLPITFRQKCRPPSRKL
ncbi:MAG: hypothetical protein CMM47_05015 [Rhodospirillaceae bacterium]|nr:hypothetical protein [Rhodospirillaceae bacterium]